MQLGRASEAASAAEIRTSELLDSFPWLVLQPAGAAMRATDIGAEDLMHATAHRRPFTAAGWAFEMKLDGLRVLARRVDDRVHLLSRRGRSLARAFPEIVELLEQVQGDWVLDGADCSPRRARYTRDAEALRRRAVIQAKADMLAGCARQTGVPLCLFDVLFKDGHDLRALPLSERQVRLSASGGSPSGPADREFVGIARQRPFRSGCRDGLGGYCRETAGRALSALGVRRHG